MATTADGGQLYFSTVFRQKGTAQGGTPKIVRWERGRGFEWFAERERVLEIGGRATTNFFKLSRPQVSADGRVVAYQAVRECFGGSSCAFVQYAQSEIVGGVRHTVQGNVWLSPDGAHAIERRDQLPGGCVIYWRDFSAGTERRLDGCVMDAVSFSDQGQALVNQNGRWRLVDGRGMVREFPEVDGLKGCRIAWNGLGPLCGEELLAVTDNAGGLYLNARGELRYMLAGRGRFHAVDVTAATISGYGNVIYYTTKDNQLMRHELASGMTEELAGPTPPLTEWLGGVAPGALNFVVGPGWWPVRVNGRVMEREGEGRFLLPLDLEMGPATLEPIGRDTAFEAAPLVREAKGSDPEFIQFGTHVPGTYGPVMVNEDFSAVVDHAAPGTIVHFYLTGLGGATPACTVRFLQETPRAAETLYIGPAPGIAGVDQFSMRVPADAPEYFVLSCGTDARAQVFVRTR